MSERIVVVGLLEVCLWVSRIFKSRFLGERIVVVGLLEVCLWVRRVKTVLISRAFRGLPLGETYM